MGIHDWRRVDAGTYHGFHIEWVVEMKRALNKGLLPPDYYADAERRASLYEADVLTLERESTGDGDDAPPLHFGGNGQATALAAAPVVAPRLSGVYEADENAVYALKRRTIVVRHSSGDRIVALIELASPGNKDRRTSVDDFVTKACDALRAGVHVAVVDPFPPRRPDGPGGLIGAVADAAGFTFPPLPEDKPLAIGSFEADRPPRLYAEPLAVGQPLPDLPLFYAVDRFVEVPLAATYAAAWEATPKRWRDVVDGTAAR